MRYFFSAAQKQMDQLEADGLIGGWDKKKCSEQSGCPSYKKGQRYRGYRTGRSGQGRERCPCRGKCTGWKVYKRSACQPWDPSRDRGCIKDFDGGNVKAFGGVEISEQDNVSKVLIAVTEGSCEVGTTYYSDTYGYEDQVKVLQTVSYDLTGNVIYPICQVENKEADDAQKEAAAEFLEYVVSEKQSDF